MYLSWTKQWQAHLKVQTHVNLYSMHIFRLKKITSMCFIILRKHKNVLVFFSIFHLNFILGFPLERIWTICGTQCWFNIECHRLFKSFFNEKPCKKLRTFLSLWKIFYTVKDPFIPHSYYHGYWWHGHARSQFISSHDTDIVLPEYYSLCTWTCNKYHRQIK